MTIEEQYIADKWYNEWHSPIMMIGKRIIVIDKNNNRSYLIYSNGNGNISILKKSKKCKNILSQIKNLFPEIDFSITKKHPFKFIHLFEDNPDNEIVFSIKHNTIIGGGFGIYEI